MYSAFRRCSIFLLAMVLIAGLNACTTTDTGSRAVIEDSSLEQPTPEDTGEKEKVVEETPPEVAPATAETQPAAEPSASVESTPVEQATEPETSGATTGATTGAAGQAETVEPVAEFPVQKYTVDEPVAADNQDDAEIDRLREELASTESELEKMRAEEENRKYSSSEGTSAAESSGTDVTSSETDMASTGAEPGVAPMPPEQESGRTQLAESQAPMEPKARPDISDLPGMPADTSVYFDFDQAIVGSQYESVIVANANFLKDHPDLKVEVQGNCDERGSREYNIALGQRRAQTVKQALELLGVDGARIDTVSFGSEKPAAFGHDEASWRLNRRADLVYSY
jgi:peptidoglycan-associated lipoprotein